MIFYWNGIKDEKGAKLQKVSYSDGKLTNHPEGTITIYGCNYSSFSKKVNENFRVKNDSDGMTDYFENSSIRVLPTHPLYNDIKAAMLKRKEHYNKLNAKKYPNKAA